MQQDPILQLDAETQRGGEGALKLRICIPYALGYTSTGAAPIVTADCRELAELEAEVARLKGELDAALEQARSLVSEAPAASAGTVAASEAVSSAKPHLDPGLTVADLMTRDVRTVGRNDRLSVAEELMRLGRLRHAVVLDDEGGLAGVLSQRDIFFGALAWSLGQGQDAHRKALDAFLVKDVMHTDVVTVAPDASLGEAADRMSERKVGCLPVLEGPRLVGILTEGDFLALLSRSTG